MSTSMVPPPSSFQRMRPPPAQPPRRDALQFSWADNGDRLIGLGFVNALLKVVTLGIYSFWGKTEVRRRLWSFVRLNGEPLEYTGTGKELFLGFLVVFGCLLLPIMVTGLAVALLFPGSRTALAIYQLCFYLLFFLLIGNAIYRAQRYRMSRTEWRGIRGALAGSPTAYGWTYFWTLAVPILLLILVPAALSAVALGNPQMQIAAGSALLVGFALVWWVLPWRANLLQRVMTNDMRFGDRPFSYSGGSGPLYKRYVLVWLSSIILFGGALAASAVYLYGKGVLPPNPSNPRPPTGLQMLVVIGIFVAAFLLWGLVTAWYKANQISHFARHTHYEGATFRAEVRGRGIMWLVLSNRLLSLLALAIGVGAGAGVLYALGWNSTGFVPGGPPPSPWEIYPKLLVIGLPVILATSIASTFAQFRTARYVASRMALDGAVDLVSIGQGVSRRPGQGEGLAQAFDVDAF